MSLTSVSCVIFIHYTIVILLLAKLSLVYLSLLYNMVVCFPRGYKSNGFLYFHPTSKALEEGGDKGIILLYYVLQALPVSYLHNE